MRFLKIKVAIALVVAVALSALAMTKPDHMEHYRVVKKEAIRVVDRQLARIPLLDGMTAPVSMAALNMLDGYLGRYLLVYDHTFYNVGIILLRNQRYMVTIGAAGYVWMLVDADDLEKYLDSQDILNVLGL